MYVLVPMFRHHFTISCFSMTVVPSKSVWLGMGRVFRLGINKCCQEVAFSH